MQSQGRMLGAIEHLVVRNDLYDVREIARTLASAPADPELERWPGLSALARHRAEELAASTSTSEACRQAARLAQACGRCHVEAHVGTIFGPAPAASDPGPTVAEHAVRQLWAIDRMSDSLVDGYDTSWGAGVSALVAKPAVEAVEDDATARARAYGDALAACARCHATGGTAVQ
jgi:hypothetical protein